MITLEEIEEFAIKNEACDTEYYPFRKYIRNGDEKSAWQTVLGNISWLNKVGLQLDADLPNILELADYTGIDHFSLVVIISNVIKYDSSGNICNVKSLNLDGSIFTYSEYNKFREYHGKRIMYYPNGTKEWESNYIDGKENGIRSFYDSSGYLISRCKYVDGERICELPIEEVL